MIGRWVVDTERAAGPRSGWSQPPPCAAAPGAYATVVEAVREGYLLHYAESRLLPDLDPDLRLLIGDHLYARGIEQLAGLGDRLAVNELSDLISLAAQIDASARPSSAPAEAAWLGSAVVIATGASAAHERAKATLRASGDARPLWRAAAEAPTRAGISGSLAEAVDAVADSPPTLLIQTTRTARATAAPTSAPARDAPEMSGRYFEGESRRAARSSRSAARPLARAAGAVIILPALGFAIAPIFDEPGRTGRRSACAATSCPTHTSRA